MAKQAHGSQGRADETQSEQAPRDTGRRQARAVPWWFSRAGQKVLGGAVPRRGATPEADP